MGCKEECTLESKMKFGREIKIKSINQEVDCFKENLCVGYLVSVGDHIET